MCDRKHPSELPEDQRARVTDFEARAGVEVLEIDLQDDGLIVPTLINGSPVQRANWPEVVRIGNRSCTGTVVGKNAVITAAHCGRHNSRSTLELHTGQRISYRMIHMPQYRGGSNFDLAVLAMESEVDLRPAIVGIGYQFQTGADVDILGYGCTRIGGGGGNDGVLRFGESKVQGFTGTDVITQYRPGGAALCFGDSGGPMMKDGSNSGGQRTLIAVNSKGNIRDTNYNMRLDWDSVEDFLRATADRYDLEIVGVTSPGPDPDPDPDPEPGDNTAVWANLAKDHRAAVQFHETQATKYENLLGSGSGSGGGNNGGSSSGGGPTFGL